MATLLDILVVLLVLLNFRLLGSSRLAACVQTVAAQAVLLGAAALATNWGALELHLVLIVLLSVAIKAGLLPWLLRRAIRQAGASREIEPIVGFSFSLLVGVVLLGLCFVIASPLHVPGGPPGGGLLVPAALFTAVTGLFLIVARKKAVTQVLGYLGMENGIYAFGTAFAVREPVLVEMAVLLDVLVAVLVMGITIYHISREFDHIDTDRMTALKD
jgi:hydrogenase-4 component E